MSPAKPREDGTQKSKLFEWERPLGALFEGGDVPAARTGMKENFSSDSFEEYRSVRCGKSRGIPLLPYLRSSRCRCARMTPCDED